ncbi:MAG: hypothetical protein FWG55_00360 [Candidatus Bathyarchaeota archaeon]|nr:hypothetical protein [Candidatus Termiticorpusculum sp.]
MTKQINHEQINNQINKLKELKEKTTEPAVNMYILMALRQLVKIPALNENTRFQVWRMNKALECLCAAMQLMQCTKETKSELITITFQLEKITNSMT